MPPRKPRSEGALRALGNTLVALIALAFAGPALAGGQQGGNLQPLGTLLLELDATTSQFRLVDCVDVDPLGNGDECDDTLTAPNTLGIQVIFDQKLIKSKDACLVGLLPPDTGPTGVVPGDTELVSLPGAPAPFTDWGIDANKFALGSRIKRGGTGCGQIELGETARLEVVSGFVTDANIQVEAKLNASAKVTLILKTTIDGDTTEEEVGTRYLLSGNAPDNPPQEVVDACLALEPPVAVMDCELVTAILGRADGGPDSAALDDGFWPFSAPAHNIEVYTTLTNSNGNTGRYSIKGGGEFPDPVNNRSTWIAFESDGFTRCGTDGFSTAGGAVTGGRTFAGECGTLPFDLGFAIGLDNQLVTFNTLESTSQFATYHFDVLWDPETAEWPISSTIFSYAAEVNCDVPLVDPEGDGPFSESCIGMKLCEGTPVRGCDGDVDVDGVPTAPCEKDTDCDDDEACQFLDLEPPVPDGFPDLVRICNNGDPCQENTDCTVGDCNTDATGEYVCICEENVLYLGPKCSNDGTVDCTDDTVVADCNTPLPFCDVGEECSNNGATCTVDSDCANTCVEQFVAKQCIFFTGDAQFKRGGKRF